MNSMRDAYDELYLYTLEHGGAPFILQHVAVGELLREQQII